MLFVIAFNSCNTRNATNSDISVEVDTSITKMAVEIEITPYVDISELEIEVNLYDGNTFLKTVKKTVGDVKKNVSTKQYLYFSDIGLSNLLVVDNTTVKVVGGKVG